MFNCATIAVFDLLWVDRGYLVMCGSDYDVIVVGAGVAGASLAIALGRDGRRVLVIERELWRSSDGCDAGTSSCESRQLAEPSRIVGELLQPGGVQALARLGLSDALRNIDAQQIFGYGIFLDGKSACLDYTSSSDRSNQLQCSIQKDSAASRGRSVGNRSDYAKRENDVQRVAGSSFHNGRFLRRLRELALQESYVTLVEGNVFALDKDQHGRVVGVSYRARSNDTAGRGGDDSSVATCTIVHARAPLTIACDGCASNLRKRATPRAEVRVYSHFVGLILNIATLPYPEHGHVVLANQAPVLFYPISSTEVRCLIDVPSTVSVPVGDHILQHVVPQVPVPFRDAIVDAVRQGQAKSMPNRVMPAAPAVVPGAILLGDSFNMRHPLTGGGMTVALSDVDLLRTVLRAVPHFSDLPRVQTALDLFYTRRMPLSSTINILANALYAVFCATEDPALVDMRSACFSYLCAGGRRSYDPIAMLGGIKPYPLLLIVHFFAVAIYGCFITLFPFPTPARFAKAYSIIRAAYKVVKPLIVAEGLFSTALLLQ